MCALRFATRLKVGANRMQDSALWVWGQTPQARLGSFGTPNRPCAVKLALALSKEAASPMPRQVGGLGNSVRVLHVKNPATRNRTRDHLISATLYSQMLYQLSHSRSCLSNALICRPAGRMRNKFRRSLVNPGVHSTSWILSLG